MRSKSRHSMFEVSPILVLSAARFGDENEYLSESLSDVMLIIGIIRGGGY